MYKITIKGNTLAELYQNLRELCDHMGAPSLEVDSPIVTSLLDDTPSSATVVAVPTPVATPVVPTPIAPPVAPPVAPVPLATPTYTLEQLARAGAQLVDMGKMPEAQAMLEKYNVATVTNLAVEHYGALASDLRALGAII
jgi:hypothetical protein